jgi:Holliday junction resolvase-like predicted endonuclease
MLKKLQNADLLCLKENTVETNSNNRLELAVKAISLGADIERVSGFFSRKEFEDIASLVLERNGYYTAKNVRFKHAGRRWEIDVVGCRTPLVLCLDCKHWQRGLNLSSLRKIVEAQSERVHALADVLPSARLKVECAKWDKAKFVPMILSLIPSSLKLYDSVPVVPILQLQDFLIQLPVHLESVKHFIKNFRHL